LFLLQAPRYKMLIQWHRRTTGQGVRAGKKVKVSA
jgi:hypothetical protein